MLKKRIFWGLAIALLCILIVGYGGNDDVSSGGSEVTLASGWKIHYIEHGPKNAPVVLLVHGLGGSSEYWRQLLSCPEIQKYRLLAIDMLGFGSSDKPKDFDYSMEKQAEAIRESLTLKGVDKVTYVGHSMAGAVGMTLIQQQPGLVKKLVLVDSTLSADYLGDKTFNRISRWGEWKFRLVFPFLKVCAKKLTSPFFGAPSQQTINMAAHAMRQSTYYSFHRSLKRLHRSLEEHQFLEDFKGLKIPHYYVFGTEDEWVARMVNDNFRSEPFVYAFEKAVHCPMVDDPESFCTVLAGILGDSTSSLVKEGTF
ncbi:MAG: alpha/beta hydrolase [Deltaproteobacteria bacterium]|nr:alpha/beta hydrolase [Deltaproteobacteria bacterium]